MNVDGGMLGGMKCPRQSVGDCEIAVVPKKSQDENEGSRGKTKAGRTGNERSRSRSKATDDKQKIDPQEKKIQE
jgi:hypothetical protein